MKEETVTHRKRFDLNGAAAVVRHSTGYADDSPDRVEPKKEATWQHKKASLNASRMPSHHRYVKHYPVLPSSTSFSSESSEENDTPHHPEKGWKSRKKERRTDRMPPVVMEEEKNPFFRARERDARSSRHATKKRKHVFAHSSSSFSSSSSDSFSTSPLAPSMRMAAPVAARAAAVPLSSSVFSPFSSYPAKKNHPRDTSVDDPPPRHTRPTHGLPHVRTKVKSTTFSADLAGRNQRDVVQAEIASSISCSSSYSSLSSYPSSSSGEKILQSCLDRTNHTVRRLSRALRANSNESVWKTEEGKGRRTHKAAPLSAHPSHSHRRMAKERERKEDPHPPHTNAYVAHRHSKRHLPSEPPDGPQANLPSPPPPPPPLYRPPVGYTKLSSLSSSSGDSSERTPEHISRDRKKKTKKKKDPPPLRPDKDAVRRASPSIPETTNGSHDAAYRETKNTVWEEGRERRSPHTDLPFSTKRKSNRHAKDLAVASVTSMHHHRSPSTTTTTTSSSTSYLLSYSICSVEKKLAKYTLAYRERQQVEEQCDVPSLHASPPPPADSAAALQEVSSSSPSPPPLLSSSRSPPPPHRRTHHSSRVQEEAEASVIPRDRHPPTSSSHASDAHSASPSIRPARERIPLDEEVVPLATQRTRPPRHHEPPALFSTAVLEGTVSTTTTPFPSSSSSFSASRRHDGMRSLLTHTPLSPARHTAHYTLASPPHAGLSSFVSSSYPTAAEVIPLSHRHRPVGRAASTRAVDRPQETPGATPMHTSSSRPEGPATPLSSPLPQEDVENEDERKGEQRKTVAERVPSPKEASSSTMRGGRVESRFGARWQHVFASFQSTSSKHSSVGSSSASNRVEESGRNHTPTPPPTSPESLPDRPPTHGTSTLSLSFLPHHTEPQSERGEDEASCTPDSSTDAPHTPFTTVASPSPPLPVNASASITTAADTRADPTIADVWPPPNDAMEKKRIRPQQDLFVVEETENAQERNIDASPFSSTTTREAKAAKKTMSIPQSASSHPEGESTRTTDAERAGRRTTPISNSSHSSHHRSSSREAIHGAPLPSLVASPPLFVPDPPQHVDPTTTMVFPTAADPSLPVTIRAPVARTQSSRHRRETHSESERGGEERRGAARASLDAPSEAREKQKKETMTPKKKTTKNSRATVTPHEKAKDTPNAVVRTTEEEAYALERSDTKKRLPLQTHADCPSHGISSSAPEGEEEQKLQLRNQAAKKQNEVAKVEARTRVERVENGAREALLRTAMEETVWLWRTHTKGLTALVCGVEEKLHQQAADHHRRSAHTAAELVQWEMKCALIEEKLASSRQECEHIKEAHQVEWDQRMQEEAKVQKQEVETQKQHVEKQRQEHQRDQEAWEQEKTAMQTASREAMQELDQEFTTTVASYKELLEEASSKIDLLRKSVRRNKHAKKTLAAKEKEWSEKGNALEQEKNRLEEQMTTNKEEFTVALASRAAELEAKMASLTKELQEKEEALTAAVARANEAEEQQRTLTGTLHHLQDQLTSQEKVLQDTTTASAAKEIQWETILADKKATLESHQRRSEETLTALKRQLKEKDTKLCLLAASSNEPIQRLRGQLEDERRRRLQVEGRLSALRRQAKEAEEKVAREMRKELLRGRRQRDGGESRVTPPPPPFSTTDRAFPSRTGKHPPLPPSASPPPSPSRSALAASSSLPSATPSASTAVATGAGDRSPPRVGAVTSPSLVSSSSAATSPTPSPAATPSASSFPSSPFPQWEGDSPSLSSTSTPRATMAVHAVLHAEAPPSFQLTTSHTSGVLASTAIYPADQSQTCAAREEAATAPDEHSPQTEEGNCNAFASLQTVRNPPESGGVSEEAPSLHPSVATMASTTPCRPVLAASLLPSSSSSPSRIPSRRTELCSPSPIPMKQRQKRRPHLTQGDDEKNRSSDTKKASDEEESHSAATSRTAETWKRVDEKEEKTQKKVHSLEDSSQSSSTSNHRSESSHSSIDAEGLRLASMKFGGEEGGSGGEAASTSFLRLALSNRHGTPESTAETNFQTRDTSQTKPKGRKEKKTVTVSVVRDHDDGVEFVEEEIKKGKERENEEGITSSPSRSSSLREGSAPFTHVKSVKKEKNHHTIGVYPNQMGEEEEVEVEGDTSSHALDAMDFTAAQLLQYICESREEFLSQCSKVVKETYGKGIRQLQQEQRLKF